MATSVVQVCNQALARLGANLINSLDDASEEARLCNVSFAHLRDEVLRAHAWNFATRRAQLARLAGTPAYGFDYRYKLPSDCLTPLELNSRESEWVAEGGELLCNLEEVYLRYTARVVNPVLFDAQFTTALVARLAAELAMPLINSNTQAEMMWSLYQRQIQAAAGTDGLDDNEDYAAAEPNPYVDVR